MTSNTLLLKCKTKSGPYTLRDLTTDSTVFDLKNLLYKIMDIKPEDMKILFGYPPKALANDKDGSKLHEVNISSGDTIIIETLKIPNAASTSVSDSYGTQEEPSQINIAKDKEMEQILSSQVGILMRHVVPSDNSCLFNSIHFLLQHSSSAFTPQKSYEMRQIIAKTIKQNPLKYNAAVLGMENSAYINWILDQNHWGGAIELAIFSEHFNIEIVAVDTITLRMHRFGENDNHPQRIFLIYDGIHYDPLILELGHTKQAIFSVAETNLLDMALEVAKEAQSSRQFTDVANFTVACQICKVRFCGDKEAMEHAKNTGHTEFGEL